jgi:hypothetical protein
MPFMATCFPPCIAGKGAAGPYDYFLVCLKNFSSPRKETAFKKQKQASGDHRKTLLKPKD